MDLSSLLDFSESEYLLGKCHSGRSLRTGSTVEGVLVAFRGSAAYNFLVERHMKTAMSKGGTKRIRVGIIGANPDRGWAAQAHIPALKSLSDDFEIRSEERRVGKERTDGRRREH